MMGFLPGMLGLMLFIWVGCSLKTQRKDEVLAPTRSTPEYAVRTSAKPTPRVSLWMASISRADRQDAFFRHADLRSASPIIHQPLRS